VAATRLDVDVANGSVRYAGVDYPGGNRFVKGSVPHSNTATWVTVRRIVPNTRDCLWPQRIRIQVVDRA
jgi:hypothetical protein